MTDGTIDWPREIRTAFDRVAPRVRRTPVIAIDAGSFGTPGPVTLKLECLQHAGSFKPRGAFNRILSNVVPATGVIAASGGNHGLAVAFAARELGLPAEIFVPEIASPVKVAGLRALQATVHVTGAAYADALIACEARQRDSGALMVHAYDQLEVLAGQGTTGLEFEAQVPDLDTVLVAVGGGGFIGGIAAWFGGRVKVVGVEPETSCALHAALAAGEPVDVPVSGIAADSLGARRVGRTMFPIAQRFVDRVVRVADADIRAAQQALWRRLRIVAEPGGATALSALMAGAYQPASGERIGVLVCGANCAPESVT
ncbi:MAG: threonine/serine dehydratase [Burkholderiales bacterium]|nr:threonine/serine dehydratase [Burkholderiales bacterium]